MASALNSERQNGPANRVHAEDDSTEHLLIANVASASFGELWDLMRSSPREKRMAWARELEQLPPGTIKTAAIKTFYKIWVELDPEAAIQAVTQIHDKKIQGLASQAVVSAAADSALPLVVELEDRLGHDLNYFSGSSVLFRWATSDPEAVSRFLADHSMIGSSPYFDVASSWAAVDPAKAAEWFEGLNLPPLHNPKSPRQKDERRNNAARGLLLSWVAKDAAGAANYVSAHASDPEISKTLAEFCYALCSRSREQASTFIRSLPNETDQRAALATVFEYLGDPWVLREGGDEEEPPEPEIPKEEIPTWLAALPQRLWIDKAGSMFSRWESTDPAGADAWLRTLPPETRSKAVVYYISYATREDATRVHELAKNIADPKLRNETLQQFVKRLNDEPQRN
jgi:hypothetical protein